MVTRDGQHTKVQHVCFFYFDFLLVLNNAVDSRKKFTQTSYVAPKQYHEIKTISPLLFAYCGPNIPSFPP